MNTRQPFKQPPRHESYGTGYTPRHAYDKWLNAQLNVKQDEERLLAELEDIVAVVDDL